MGCFLQSLGTMVAVISIILATNTTASPEWSISKSVDQSNARQPLLASIVNESTTGITLSYKIPECTFSRVNFSGSSLNREVSSIDCGSLDKYANPGEPLLPFIPAKILLPQDKTIETIRVECSDMIEIEGNHFIEYAPQLKPTSSQSPLSTGGGMNREIYSSNHAFPSEKYSLVSIQNCRGAAIAFVNLFPVTYYPVSQRVVVSRTMTLHISYKDNNSSRFSNLAAWTDGVSIQDFGVENPQTMQTYVPRPARAPVEHTSLCRAKDTVDYLIISSQAILTDTTSPTSIKTLIDQRQKQRLRVKTESIEKIKTTYSGTDDAAKMRKYIIDAYNTNKIKYVCLIGNPPVLPYKLFTNPDQEKIQPDSRNIPSDLYFQCLEGTFDANNNGIFAEADDIDNGMSSLDLTPEVAIGRILASTPQELSNNISKIIAYERYKSDDEYLRSGLFLGEYLFPSNAENDPSMWNATASMEEIRTELFIKEQKVKTDTVYEVYQNTVPGSSYATKLNSNKFSMVTHLGHGQYTSVMKQNSFSSVTATKPLFVISQACYCGGFDKSCIAKGFTVGSKTGMFAVIMNSREGWSPELTEVPKPPRPTDGPSMRLQKGFWKALFVDTIYRLGDLNKKAHIDVYPKIKIKYQSMAYYETNLLGDPAIHMRVKRDCDTIPDNPTAITSVVGQKLLSGITVNGSKIRIKLLAQAPLSIMLINGKGQSIHSLNFNKLEPGTHTVLLSQLGNSSTLANGLYLVKVVSGTTSMYTKVVFSR